MQNPQLLLLNLHTSLQQESYSSSSFLFNVGVGSCHPSMSILPPPAPRMSHSFITSGCNSMFRSFPSICMVNLFLSTVKIHRDLNIRVCKDSYTAHVNKNGPKTLPVQLILIPSYDPLPSPSQPVCPHTYMRYKFFSLHQSNLSACQQLSLMLPLVCLSLNTLDNFNYHFAQTFGNIKHY